MGIPILTTKLHIPLPPREFVSRPRLIDRLNAGLDRKVTLISASAGFGKTTLLSEWIHSQIEGLPISDYRIGWLSCDEEDSDPIRFWSYFGSALQGVYPSITNECLTMLDSPSPPPIRTVLTLLINAIAGGSDRTVMVLDDYHVIHTRPIHEAMVFLIDHQPPQFHLVIASRVDPPLPLARLRGRGQLNELRTEDLRFTSSETMAFFNEVMGLNLTEQNVAALETRAEGWIASLQMAAISLQGRADVTDFIDAFSGTHRYVVDYLAEEVLGRQDAHLREFLLKTSVLNRLSGPLCDVLTGDHDGQEQLEALAAANLFLTPLDDTLKWFRYHHLFADLLRSQLQRLHPEWVGPLHRQASEWYEREGVIDEAVHHALSIPDYERAARLIESIAVQTINECRLVAPRGWLARLPEELVFTRPWLCVSIAEVRLASGKFDEAESLIDRAAALLAAAEQTGDRDAYGDYASIHSHIMAFRAMLACLRGDLDRALELAQRNLDEIPEDQAAAALIMTYVLGRGYWMSGQMFRAIHYFTEVVRFGEETGNFFLALASMGYMADIQCKLGRLEEAARINREAIRLGNQWGGGEPLPATSCAYLGLAQVLYQWNEIDRAIEEVTKGIELGRQGVESTLAMTAYPVLASLNELQKRSSTFTEALEQARHILYISQNAVTSSIAEAWLARLALANGDLTTAETWAISAKDRNIDLHSIPECWQEFAYLTLVRFHIARGEAEEVPEALDRLCLKIETEGRRGNLIEVLILRSMALHSLEKPDEAMISLERALRLAEPEGYIRIFIDEGRPMATLLNRAVDSGIMTDYVRRLLASHEATDSEAAVSVQNQLLDEPLTEREIEVLRLIAAGRSNREISEELFVVLGTVKTHINSIYRKLEVHSRTQALARAQELNLI